MISNKGASPTLVMLIIIVFLFFFFYAYSITLANETNKQAVINLRQADVIRLENSFNLFNTSLGITWYISSIQTLFSATNPHSLGCGEDDAVYATDDFLLPGYWYRYDNESGPKNSGKAVTWIAGPGTKYNYVTIDYQPHICYPSDKNITDYLQEKFRGDFINNIPEIPSPKSPESLTSFAVGGVNYKIDKKTIYNNFTLDDNGVNSSTEQLISLATSSGSIGQKTINNFTIDTELPLIFRAARNFVDWIINYDVFSISYRDISYKINGNDAFDNKDSYLGRMKKNFDDISNGIKIDNNMQVTQVTTNYNTFELFAADHNGNIMKEGEGTVGLIFHYDVTENFNEGGTTSGSGTCTLPPNIAQYQTII
ncbi:MAG: hypothetical protein NT120_02395, partial [Candidatus Aenigmarchaeota archaeon]|nr:hypothetical protein [Candidatus Aenigmarchaeota archaeon]